MIRPLRQRHRHLVIALGIFLPVAFAAGIAARKPVPDMASLPGSLVAAPVNYAADQWERGDLFPKSPVQIRWLREVANTGHFAVAFSAAKDFVKPDLIVYWVAGNPDIADTLPDNAILLGSFGVTPLPVPGEAAKTSGELVLFSLADNEIVDVSKPLNFGGN